MAQGTWPPGIRPGKCGGIHIELWRHSKRVYSETLPGDPYKKRDLTAAINRRQELLSRLQLGLPLHQGDTAAKRRQFSGDAQDYMNTLDAKRSTHLCYENDLNHLWIPAFGHWITTEITTADIKKALASLTVSQKRKKNLLIPLRGVLDHAGLNPNPARGVHIKKGQSKPVQRYTPKERASLMRKLADPQARAYFALLFGGGLRPGEALALQWTDYDGEQIHVAKQITRRRLEDTTKTSMYRNVYLPQWVREELNNLPTRFKGEWLFLNSKGTVWKDTDFFNGEWRKAHKRARLPYRIPYTCRHTRAAELLSIGIAPAEAAKQLGHTVEMFFRVYSDWIEEYSGKQDRSRFEGIGIEISETNF